MTRQATQPGLADSLWVTIAAVVAVVFIVVVILISRHAKKVESGKVETYPEQSRQHIAIDAPHEPYNSNPPTSGPHFQTPADWGIYITELPDVVTIHNLEHGGIVISYQPSLDPQQIAQLKALVNSYHNKLVLEPRAADPEPIDLTAWTKLKRLQSFNDTEIRSFIDAFLNHGPETVPL